MIYNAIHFAPAWVVFWLFSWLCSGGGDSGATYPRYSTYLLFVSSHWKVYYVAMYVSCWLAALDELWNTLIRIIRREKCIDIRLYMSIGRT